MLGYFKEFWSGAKPAQGGGGERDAIAISPAATVSLDRNGAVFLHSGTGMIFTANRVGAAIWRGLRDRESVDAIASRLSDENGVQYEQVRRETAEFVAELETHGFLARGNEGKL
jgi:hypothetical protein